MPKLSLIAAEAERLLGRLPEPRRLALEQTMVELCEEHWQELRGPEPTMPLARALWSQTPPLADLYADLYTVGDMRLEDMLQEHRPAWGLALLTLAEIARGNAEGARLAHEPMMAFEMESAGAQLAARMADALHGRAQPIVLHKHPRQQPLWRALAVIAAHTGRCDLKAVIETIRLLSEPTALDPTLERLRSELDEIGVRFVAVEEDHVRYTQHGHAHKAASFVLLTDLLMEIRQLRMG